MNGDSEKKTDPWAIDYSMSAGIIEDNPFLVKPREEISVSNNFPIITSKSQVFFVVRKIN